MLKDNFQRILNLLPEQKAKEYMMLWHEFEAGETADAKYGKAIDRGWQNRNDIKMISFLASDAANV